MLLAAEIPEDLFSEYISSCELEEGRYFVDEEITYDVCVNSNVVSISCKCQYFIYHDTACKHMFLAKRFMPSLDVFQTIIDTDFNSAGNQPTELNQVEDGNNNSSNVNSDNNSNSNINEDTHIDTNNINNDISSNLLELQNLLVVNISYENDKDFTAATDFNNALIEFKKSKDIIIKQNTESLPNNVNMQTQRN